MRRCSLGWGCSGNNNNKTATQTSQATPATFGSHAQRLFSSWLLVAPYPHKAAPQGSTLRLPPSQPSPDDDNDAVLFERIKRGAYDVDDCIWDDISPEAKHLVAALLTVDASQRLTAAQALEHHWLKQQAATS